MFDLKNYDGHKVVCSCKREHKPVIENILNKKNIISDIASVVKNYYAAGHIAFVTSADIPQDIVESVEKNLKKSYKVTTIIFQKNAEKNRASAEKISLCPEQVRFIVGLGSGSLNDIIKLALKFREKTDYIFCPTAPSTSGYFLSHFNYTDNGILKTERSHIAKCIVLDENLYSGAPKYLVAAGCGEIFSRYLTLFDNYFESRLSKAHSCLELTNAIRNKIDEFVDECLKNGYVTPKSVMETLADISLKESVLFEDTALKSGEALASLIGLISGRNSVFGTDLFISAVSVLSFYKLYLSEDFADITLPCDKLAVVNSLRKNCGLNYIYYLNEFALDKSSDYLKDSYILKEYKKELKDFLDGLPSLSVLCSIFRRFFSDCGYFLNSYIGQKEIFSLMCSASPLIKGTPLLKHLITGGFAQAVFGLA